jgi:hypothetical protein
VLIEEHILCPHAKEVINMFSLARGMGIIIGTLDYAKDIVYNDDQINVAIRIS